MNTTQKYEIKNDSQLQQFNVLNSLKIGDFVSFRRGHRKTWQPREQVIGFDFSALPYEVHTIDKNGVSRIRRFTPYNSDIHQEWAIKAHSVSAKVGA